MKKIWKLIVLEIKWTWDDLQSAISQAINSL